MTIFGLISCSLLAGAASGFSTQLSSFQNRREAVAPLFAADPVVYAPVDAADNHRRNVIASVCTIGTAAALSSFLMDAPMLGIPTSSIDSSTITKLASVEEAVQLIESSCDRRFLHAVVASDYQLMYRGLPSTKRQVITTRNEPETVLESDAQVFSSIETILQGRPLVPSNSRLAVSNPEAAKRWGTQVVSVWPLGENVHFAWLEQGSAFSNADANPKIIVDGVDCGRMSLEDALESNKEIMFRAESGYLAVPLFMEKELVSKLKGAFII
jgi:hypothetical protein